MAEENSSESDEGYYKKQEISISRNSTNESLTGNEGPCDQDIRDNQTQGPQATEIDKSLAKFPGLQEFPKDNAKLPSSENHDCSFDSFGIGYQNKTTDSSRSDAFLPIDSNNTSDEIYDPLYNCKSVNTEREKSPNKKEIPEFGWDSSQKLVYNFKDMEENGKVDIADFLF